MSVDINDGAKLKHVLGIFFFRKANAFFFFKDIFVWTKTIKKLQ